MSYGLIISLLLVCAVASQPVAAQPATGAEPQKRLAEQKLRLVEMLVNSPAAQASAASSDAETAALVERSRELLRQAREDLGAQRHVEAAKTLDEALRSVAKANSRNSGGLTDSAQKQRLQDMTEQVATYRTSLAELAKVQGGATSARASLQKVDALTEESRKLAAAGRLGDANKKIAEAYQLEIEETSRLRAGQEVVMSLKFDSPVDEYAYEQKRFQSNEILLGMMIAEGRAQGDEKRRLVDGFVKEAVRLREDAAALAQANGHKEAVATMEKAIVQLNRALQSVGVPVF